MVKTKHNAGEYGEHYPWELRIPYEYDSTEWNSPHFVKCPHLEFTSEPVPQYRNDGSIWGYKRTYRLPGAAICTNEGGHNSTILCIACLDDARAATSATPHPRQSDTAEGPQPPVAVRPANSVSQS